MKSGTIEHLKKIHYLCKGFLDDKNFKGLKYFLSGLINSDDIDVNILKTVLIITKDFKYHRSFKETRLEILTLFDCKMEELKKLRLKNETPQNT